MDFFLAVKCFFSCIIFKVWIVGEQRAVCLHLLELNEIEPTVFSWKPTQRSDSALAIAV